MRQRRRRWASNVCAFPIVRPRASNENASRRSAGSATARNGAPAARPHWCRQTAKRPRPPPIQRRRRNAAMGRARCDLRQSRQHRSGDEPTSCSVDFAPARNRFPPRRPPGRGFALPHTVDQRPEELNFAPGSRLGPSCAPIVAARIVSAVGIRLDCRKSVRPFKGIFCDNISEFDPPTPTKHPTKSRDHLVPGQKKEGPSEEGTEKGLGEPCEARSHREVRAPAQLGLRARRTW